MFSESSVARRVTDRTRLEFSPDGARRALGHALVALIIAFGFVRIAYAEAKWLLGQKP